MRTSERTRVERHTTFRVGVTRDFLRPDGTLGFGDIGLRLLDAQPDIEWAFLEENAAELRPEQVRDLDGLLLLGARVSRSTLEGSERLVVVARFGVGYDNVDVDACTAAGVLLTITPDGVRRPVAGAVWAFVLALSHKLIIKDRLTRAGRWDEKLDYMGIGLTGRTLGVVGLGNIGREVLALGRPFGMRYLAADPYATAADARAAGADLVDLEELLGAADFVVVCCSLTPRTRHLLDAERLALMKPTAYLVNVARGPIVDQEALTEALRRGTIQGAGLDVFEDEPIDPKDPLLELESVVLAPHAICWTDECFRGNGESACQSLVEVALGRMPRHIVNREVSGHPKLRRLAER